MMTDFVIENGFLIEYNGEGGDVIIPDCVTSIMDYAFYQCNSLTSITIPDSVTSIGDYAFYGCNNLVYNEYDNAYYLGNDTNPYVVLIKAKDKSITSCEIHPNTKAICDGAFEYCNELTSLTVASGNSVYHSAGNCLIETKTGELVAGCKNSVIPDDGSVTSIGDFAFCNCSELKSVSIPNQIEIIGAWAFCGCSGLKNITIPDGVKFVSEEAFVECCSLTSVKIGSGLAELRDDIFSGCSELAEIEVASGNTVYYSDGNCVVETKTGELVLGCKNSVIPDDGSVTSIGWDTFSPCFNLKSITIPSSVKSVCFNSLQRLETIEFKGTKEQWTAVEKWAGCKTDMPKNCKVHCIDGDADCERIY